MSQFTPCFCVPVNGFWLFWLSIVGNGVEVVILFRVTAFLITVICLGFSSFLLFCVGVTVTEFLLAFLGILCVIGLPKYGVLILFHLFRNPFIFLLKQGYSWTSAPHGLYQVICVLESFFYVWIPFSMWILRSISMVSVGKPHLRNPYTKLYLTAG